MRRDQLPVAKTPNGYLHPKPVGLQWALPPPTLRELTVSLKDQWKRYRKGLKRCQHRFSESAVHESRVQTRRLLSLVELLKPFLSAGRVKKIESSLKRHLDTFDELRDTQVQLRAVGKMRGAFPAAKLFHQHLKKRELRLARQTLKQIKRIKTKRLGKLVTEGRDQLKGWREAYSPDRANKLLLNSLNGSFARTLRFKDKIQASDTATIHRTRVAFKRFRYMVEILADYLPHLSDKRLAAMHHYQTMMGDIQDAEVLLRAWQAYRLKKPVPPPAARRFELELAHRRRWLVGVYLNAADQLREFWPLAAGAQTGSPALRAPARPLSEPRRSA